jgi:hypothetical protein
MLVPAVLLLAISHQGADADMPAWHPWHFENTTNLMEMLVDNKQASNGIHHTAELLIACTCVLMPIG